MGMGMGMGMVWDGAICVRVLQRRFTRNLESVIIIIITPTQIGRLTTRLISAVALTSTRERERDAARQASMPPSIRLDALALSHTHTVPQNRGGNSEAVNAVIVAGLF